MKQQTFEQLEQYMLLCMKDSAHDKEHVYRVLYMALELAETEPATDLDVLITACLLHDIGRQAQYDDPTICHAAYGAKMAQNYLIEQGFPAAFADHVAACIRTHRFRKNAPPQSIEAKILFDADKLDVTGAMGIARTLLYNGKVDEPLYTLNDDGTVSDGTSTLTHSFLQEYCYKLQKLYDRFYTVRGAEMAAERKAAAEMFYRQLLTEARSAYNSKRKFMEEMLKKD